MGQASGRVSQGPDHKAQKNSWLGSYIRPLKCAIESRGIIGAWQEPHSIACTNPNVCAEPHPPGKVLITRAN